MKFLTGLQISASVVPIGGLTINPTSYQWGFDGGDIDPFKDYIYGLTGERKELLAADKQKSSFDFYTKKGETAKVVCDFK